MFHFFIPRTCIKFFLLHLQHILTVQSTFSSDGSLCESYLLFHKVCFFGQLTGTFLQQPIAQYHALQHLLTGLYVKYFAVAEVVFFPCVLLYTTFKGSMFRCTHLRNVDVVSPYLVYLVLLDCTDSSFISTITVSMLCFRTTLVACTLHTSVPS